MSDPIPLPSDAASSEDRRTEPAAGWLHRLAVSLGLSAGASARAAIEEALKAGDRGTDGFSVQEITMLQRTLRFGGLRVEDVMVPRADIVAVEEQAPISDILRVFATAGHSRIPVYRDTLDDPQGMVHIKDLLRWMTDQSLAERTAPESGKAAAGGQSETPAETDAGGCSLDLTCIEVSRPLAEAGIIRDVLFVPPSMPAVDLLLRMQSTHLHLALVIDEYGGTDGLVSIEDLVEEVVGNIEDEHDINGAPLISEQADGLIADARTPIDELEQRMGLSLLPADRDDHVDTLGGLIFAMLGRVPVRGELIQHEAGIEFEILEADPRRIKKVKIPTHKGGDHATLDEQQGTPQHEQPHHRAA